MTEQEAWELFNAGRPLTLRVRGKVYEGVHISGLKLPLPAPAPVPAARRFHWSVVAGFAVAAAVFLAVGLGSYLFFAQGPRGVETPHEFRGKLFAEIADSLPNGRAVIDGERERHQESVAGWHSCVLACVELES